MMFIEECVDGINEIMMEYKLTKPIRGLMWVLIHDYAKQYEEMVKE